MKIKENLATELSDQMTLSFDLLDLVGKEHPHLNSYENSEQS